MRNRKSRRSPLSPLAIVVAMSAVMLPGIACATDGQNFSQVERGRYLVTAADCVSCHTIPNSGKNFSGGRPIETPFGNIVSPNITPDRTTGIGAWSDDEFDNAVRKGMRPDGSRLYPAMPYPSYTKMSRDDVIAIRAYLNTLEPVRHVVETNTLPFPLNIRAAMRVWDALYFTEGRFTPDPQKSAEWNRGAFLVDGPSHCTACHTPKTFLGGDRKDSYLQGSYLQGWFAPNITNDNRRGIGRWEVDDIVAYLKTGHNRMSAATGPMGEEVALSSSHMRDEDVRAIAVYLKTVSGGNSDTVTAVQPSDSRMVAGGAIYRDVCSACHGLDGRGTNKLFPSLAESPNVRSDDPTSLIRVVVRGTRAVATAAEPTAPGMPAFAWQLNDDQIAAVLTYIRNAWSPAAPPVATSAVSKVKSDLALRTD
jgi:mono/diheme cytochrome c family protein